MKKLLTLVFIVCVTASMAEGYQVNLQSARQAGMAHTGTAQKLGAESMHFNPAALVFMNNSVDLSVGASGVISKVNYSGEDNYKASTENKISTPMFVYAGFSIYKDKLSAGLAVTTPYGSSLNWGKDWAGADVIQDISLRSFVFQPTVSVKVVDGLSFGAGLMVATGTFELSRAMLPKGGMVAIGQMLGRPEDFPADKYASVLPASATLAGKAKTAVGFNLGLYYDVCNKLSVGVSYRSKMKMKVNAGDAKIDYASDKIESALGLLAGAGKFPMLNTATFAAELPLPSNFNIGVTFRPTNRWMIAYDMQFVGWSAYDELNVHFAELGVSGYNIDATKDYKNTISYRFGAQYKTTERLDIRFGAYYDETPVRSQFYNPETPGANKMGLTAGCSFMPYKNLFIDLAFSFIKGFDRNGSYAYKNGLGQQKAFAGLYNSTAYVPSLAVRYSF